MVLGSVFCRHVIEWLPTSHKLGLGRAGKGMEGESKRRGFREMEWRGREDGREEKGAWKVGSQRGEGMGEGGWKGGDRNNGEGVCGGEPEGLGRKWEGRRGGGRSNSGEGVGDGRGSDWIKEVEGRRDGHAYEVGMQGDVRVRVHGREEEVCGCEECGFTQGGGGGGGERWDGGCAPGG